MKIYTRTGDAGTTSLVGGQRISKADSRLNAYGTTDELNSFIGLLLAHPLPEEAQQTLTMVQHKLFNMGAYLATDPQGNPGLAPIDLGQTTIGAIERQIDMMSDELPPLKEFILPGGAPQAALANVCRAVCRRAERTVAQLAIEAPVDGAVITFLNRLSDYLFTLARLINYRQGIPQTTWQQ